MKSPTDHRPQMPPPGPETPSTPTGEHDELSEQANGIGLSAYLGDLLSFGGGRLAGALAVLLGAGFLEGIGLLLLIPLLSLTGFVGGGEKRNAIAETFGSLFGMLHLDYGLPAILWVFLGVVSFEALLVRQRILYVSSLELEFTDHLRNTLYRALGRAEWECHLRERSSDAIQILDESVTNIGNGTHSILHLAVLTVQSCVYLVVSLQASPWMTLIMGATGGCLLLLVRPLNRRALTQGDDAVSASRALYRSMTEFIAGMKVAKSFGAEEDHIREFETCTEQFRSHMLGFERSAATALMGFRIASAAVLSLFIYAAVTFLELPAEVLIVLIFLAHRLFNAFSSLQTCWQDVLKMLPSYRHYRVALHAYRDAEEAGLAERRETPIRLERSLSLRRVAYRYQKTGEYPAVDDIDLTISARQTVAFVGRSGAGKSTLADLIMGLLVPDRGEILVDGRLLTPDLRRAWRRHVAYVPQDVYLFNESIRDNLKRGCPAARDDSLEFALGQAAALDFVERLPRKLECVVGDRGVRLSGGERQRLALARALLSQPSLLILDEATSALDRESESQIHRAIEKMQGQLTLILIAHRLSTIKHADRIVVLEQGRIAETGTWDQLIEDENGILHRMVAAGVF